jgi:hypothetical protein
MMTTVLDLVGSSYCSTNRLIVGGATRSIYWYDNREGRVAIVYTTINRNPLRITTSYYPAVVGWHGRVVTDQ